MLSVRLPVKSVIFILYSQPSYYDDKGHTKYSSTRSRALPEDAGFSSRPYIPRPGFVERLEMGECDPIGDIGRPHRGCLCKLQRVCPVFRVVPFGVLILFLQRSVDKGF